MSKKEQFPLGFSKIELSLFISLFIVLIIGAYYVIDPSGEEGDYRNEERLIEIELLADALHAAYEDSGSISGVLAGVDDAVETVQLISNGPGEGKCEERTCGNQKLPKKNCYANIAGLTANYIESIPYDPLADESGVNTGYYVNFTKSTVTVGACQSDDSAFGLEPTIEIRR